MRNTTSDVPAIRVNNPTAGRLRIDETGFTFIPDVGGRATHWAWSDTEEYVGQPDKTALAVRSSDGQSEAWMITENFAAAHAVADQTWTQILEDLEVALKARNEKVLSGIGRRLLRR